MAFHAYILRSRSTGRFYVGHTGNLTKRIFEHNNQRTVSIKNRGPWELYYAEGGWGIDSVFLWVATSR